jgi:hypothetical protein
MTGALDVLLIESSPHAGAAAAAELKAAGHRVHRCFRPGACGFPCVGVTHPSACPIDRGIDVALLVRPRVNPRPTQLERAVSCVIRARVPLVEYGPSILDPYESWLAARAEGRVTDACVEAAASAANAA